MTTSSQQGGEAGVSSRIVTKPLAPLAPSPSPQPPVSTVAADAEFPKRCSTCQNRYPADFLVCPRDATPLDGDAVAGVDPLIGRVLGETYQIARLIGEGGMGRVYEARHLRLTDRRFAVKVLNAEYARDTDVVLRFQREAQSSSAIGHPNVLDVFDVHKTPEGVPYLVGEFLEGEELGEHLRKVGRLDVSMAAGITRQICRALNAAHALGIVHRDMKPENVFLIPRDGLPHVKVLDFGISKAAHGNTHLTRTGMIMGTPSYMAPEQARGEKVDHRADVYAVGALLYSLLTGLRPFENDDATATLTLVLTSEPPRPRSIDPQIPEGMELVVQRAMAKDPRERFQTMLELEAALEPFDDPNAPTSMAMQTLLRKGETMVVSPGKPQKLDVTARTMVASSGSGASLQEGARAAQLARPTIIAVTVGLSLWLLVGFVDALGGVVRFFRDGELTLTESILLTVGSAFAAMTPAVLFIMHVRKTVWPNSVKALELATDLKRTGVAALVTYGAAAVALRVVYTVVLRTTAELTSGAWDTGLFLASFIGALIAGGVGPIARSFRRKAND
ncbi:MAG: serine/threonine-protein kinase [Polyangiaceae bacterium]